MEENMNKNVCICHSRYYLLRWFLGLLIIILVFCVGVQLGELRGYLESAGYLPQSYHGGYGDYGRMMPMMYYNNSNLPFGMMNGNYQVVPPASTEIAPKR